MKLEDLADLSGSKLKALSDQELEEICKPFYNVTRPELAPKPEQKQTRQEAPAIQLSPQKQAALELLKEQGVDLSFMKWRKKK